MTSFYADSFRFFSHQRASVCAFLATTRPMFNSSIIPVTLHFQDLWTELCDDVETYFNITTISFEQKFLQVFLLSDTLQFAPSIRIDWAFPVENVFLSKMLTTLINERRYFCRSLKHFVTRNSECVALVCEKVKSLESVAFCTPAITNRHMDAIGNSTRLLDLTLRGRFDSDSRAVERLSGLTSLVKLNLSFSSRDTFPGDSFLHFKNMKLLRELTLCHMDCLSDDNFQLPIFPVLDTLDISHNEIHEQSLAAVAKQSTLRVLKMRQCADITSTGFEALSSALPELTELNLGGCYQIDDSCLLALIKGSSFSLRRLNLQMARVSDDSVVELAAEMTNLEVLDLECLKAPLTDLSLEAISKLKHLVELNIRFMNMDRFTVNGFRHLPTLPRLEVLKFGEYGMFTPIQFDTQLLTPISELRCLRFLEVAMDFKKISARSIAEALSILEKVPLLEKVTICLRNGEDELRSSIKSVANEFHFPFLVVIADPVGSNRVYVPR